MKPLALVVDDEPHIRRVAELAMQSIGCEVETACDGEQAWSLIQCRGPSVLVSDVQMPKMNGVELIQLVRESSESRDIPIVLLTAKGFELSQDDSELIKSCNIMCKPFSPAALARHVYEVLTLAGTS